MRNSLTIIGQAILSVISLVIFAINFLSGFVGGVWLLFSGGWALVLFGVVIGFIMPYAYMFLSVPTLLVVPLMEKLKKYKVLILIISFLLLIFNYGPLLLWVNFVFNAFISFHQLPLIPVLLSGYATVMSPLSYMVSHEREDSFGSSLGLFYAQLCYLFIVIDLIFRWSPSTVLILETLTALIFMSFSTFSLSTIDIENENSGQRVNIPNYELQSVDGATIIEPAVIHEKSQKFCKHCGKGNLAKSKYCKVCGKIL